MVHGRVENAIDAPLQQSFYSRLSHRFIAAGVDHQEQIALRPSGVLGALNNPAGKGGGGDNVGNKAKGLRAIGAKLARHCVGAVAKFINRRKDTFLRFDRNVGIFNLIDHKRDSRLRNAGLLCHIFHRRGTVTVLGFCHDELRQAIDSHPSY